MAEDFRLSVEPRTQLGSRNTSRLRKQGLVPANVYGFKKESLNVVATAEQIEKMVAKGSRVVDVEYQGNVEKAVVRELQWDIYSTHVKHVDLMRVDPEEIATVEVPVRIRGEAIGLKDGGQLRQSLKRVTLTCPAFRVPKYVTARVGPLKIGDKITVSQLERPDTATIDTPGDTVVIELYDPKAVAVSEVIG